MHSWWFGFILALVSISTAGLAAPSPELTRTHKNIQLVAMPLPPAGTYDIDLVAPGPALDAFVEAIDLIYAKSKFSAQAFDRLKKAGQISLVYDPRFPKEKFSSVTIAAFFPDFFQAEGHLKQFLVVVGRYGVKWPLKKLAAVIVHELGGHGYQHLRGRTTKDRKIDRECEAQLYEEAALQDLGVERSTSDMVRFRRAMHNNWCSDFRRYMRERDPKLMELWQFGKPDVPKVLLIFEDYLLHLQKLGISTKAITAVNRKRQSDLAKAAEDAVLRNSGIDLYGVAQRYFNGLGVVKNNGEAQKWFQRSANAQYGPALLAMGVFMEAGLAGEVNKEQAFMWYSLAAEQGIEKASQRLQLLSLQMSAKEREHGLALAKAHKPGGS